MKIFPWFLYYYTIWSCIDEEATYYGALLSIAELLLTGATTTSDMHYMFPKGTSNLIDQEIHAAKQLGIRFHPCRSAMPEMEGNTYSNLAGVGLRPQNMMEDKDAILSDMERVIRNYHHPEKFSMCQIALSLTEKTYNDPRFMEEMAHLSRKHNLLLHTHFHPRDDEILMCQQRFKKHPLDFLSDVGWLENNSWFAHTTQLKDPHIEKLAQAGCGSSHSPSSNMRVGYGIAPIPQMVRGGMNVSIAVDGGASNDTGDFLGEMKTAFLVHRSKGVHGPDFGPDATTVPMIFDLATNGGAKVLKRNELGSLEIEKAADIIMFNLDHLGYAGALHDPLGALIMCGYNHTVDTSLVNGDIVVKAGRLINMDEREIARNANRVAHELVKKAQKITGIDYSVPQPDDIKSAVLNQESK